MCNIVMINVMWCFNLVVTKVNNSKVINNIRYVIVIVCKMLQTPN